MSALTFCKVCDTYDDKPKCPKCGSNVTFGYGLAGGGIGAYEFCCDDACDYFSKTQDPIDDEPLPTQERAATPADKGGGRDAG